MAGLDFFYKIPKIEKMGALGAHKLWLKKEVYDAFTSSAEPAFSEARRDPRPIT